MVPRLLPAVLAAASLCAPVAAVAAPPAAAAPAPVQPAPTAPGPEVAPPPASSPDTGCGCHHGCAWQRHCDLRPLTPATRVSVEAGGAAAWLDHHADVRLSVKPLSTPGWSFGVGAFADPRTWRTSNGTLATGSAGLQAPGGSSTSGWSAGVRQGYDLTVTRTFSRWSPGGFFLAARLSAAQVVLQSDAAPGAEARPWLLTLTPQLGFQWFPFWQRTFYLRPWFGGELLLGNVGSLAVGGSSFPTRILSPTGGLNLGFEM